MRALIISLALLVSAVVCTGFLAIFAGFGAGAATLGSLGVGLFMVAALFAAIAALGPKLRPTPLLTPAMAGTSAAVITTMAILAGSSQIAQGKRAVLPTSEPPKVTDTASEAPSPPSPAPIEPQVASPPPPSPAMIEPQDASPPPSPAMIGPQDAGPPPEPDVEAAMTGQAPVGPDDLGLPPLQLPGAIAPAAIEGSDAAALPAGGDAQGPAGEAQAGPAGQASPAQSAGPATTVAGTDASAPVRVPIPRRPPASSGPQVLSEDGFDTSSAARPAASPTTLTLSEGGFDTSSATAVSHTPAAPAPTARVIPPLPRSRPCGEGGPACP